MGARPAGILEVPPSAPLYVAPPKSFPTVTPESPYLSDDGQSRDPRRDGDDSEDEGGGDVDTWGLKETRIPPQGGADDTRVRKWAGFPLEEWSADVDRRLPPWGAGTQSMPPQNSSESL